MLAPQLNVPSGVKNSHEVADMPPYAVHVFDGQLFNVYQWHQEMFDGTSQVFERLSRKDGAVAVAVTTDNRIIIQHEEQPGRSSYVSLPCGGFEHSEESSLDAVKRELLEESGYQSEKCSLWFESNPYGKVSNIDYIYVMRECVKCAEPVLDPGEKIRVEMVSFDEFCDIVLQDNFRTKSVSLRVATMLAQGKKEELRMLLLGT
jgi:ADP-ribose pyrophosphatase